MITPSVISTVQPVQALSSGTAAQAGSSDFGSVLQTAIRTVESTGTAARNSMEQFMTGDATDVHSIALTSQKAALQFEMFLQVRNKVVQAYQEVMRMQF